MLAGTWQILYLVCKTIGSAVQLLFALPLRIYFIIIKAISPSLCQRLSGEKGIKIEVVKEKMEG
jgi:hypothetical protein